MAERFAVDVGGTFTDIVVLDPDTGGVRFEKTPTTPHAPSEGVLRAIEKSGVALPESSAFFHGTTLGINTVLQRSGPRTGLITTHGFRDELELARLNWPMYRLYWARPPVLVERPLRREVRERVQADGTVVQPLDEGSVRAAVEALLEHGVSSIAVCLLHAYAHPAHEQRVGEIIASEHPAVEYTLSHLVTREYREYERTVTTVVDAMVKPTMARYLWSLQSSLGQRDFSGDLLITRSDGGVMSAGEAKEQSVRTLLSGPASGVMGAATFGRALEEANLLAIDMGGTSFDAALILDSEPTVRSMASIAGMPLLMPAVELATIGAGGGSIAWLDPAGTLEVGPRSAGAVPGPIAYGKGGSEPTFTDAALVSGLLDPGFYLGGEIELDLPAARRGIMDAIAEPLGLDLMDAASGIVALTEAKMAATLEQITIGKGYDTRDFALLAYGGGGSIVASALAARLEIPRVFIPPSPANFSAWGMLTLDIVHDFSRTVVSKLEDVDPEQLRETFAELEARAARVLDRERVPPSRRQAVRSMDMRYENQEHTLTVLLGAGALDSLTPDDLRKQYDDRHMATYGYSVADAVQVVAYRVRAVGILDKPSRPTLEAGTASAQDALKSTRRAHHRESGGEFEWSIYDRSLLRAGNVVHGPAIVEEPASTTLVPPRQAATVDRYGNLIITPVA